MIIEIKTAVMMKPTTIIKVTKSKVTNWVDPYSAGWKILGLYGNIYMLRKNIVEI